MSFATGDVSIPNGLHRPFSPEYWRRSLAGARSFQSRTGSTGHLAAYDLPHDVEGGHGFNPERAPQAI